MARKRDHKAEWARRKQLAQQKGYSGVKEAQRARRALNIPRTRKTPAKRAVQRFDSSLLSVIEPKSGIAKLRREAREWSKNHSRSARSAFDEDMSDQAVRAYHRAYVERVKGFSRRKAAAERRRRIGEYVIEYTDVSEDEWSQKYELMPV